MYAPSFCDWHRFSEGPFRGCQLSYLSSALLVQLQFSLTDWLSHMNCRRSTLSSPLLEERRSLDRAAEVFILLSTKTERLMTALGAYWRKITAWSLEMTQLHQPLALWCSSKVRVVVAGFRWQMAVTASHFQGSDRLCIKSICVLRKGREQRSVALKWFISWICLP